MASEKKLRADGLDFFLSAIAPVFIIGMIGSLVYFIITVCYQGAHPERLMWILGLYTVAAVLIARIAIEQSRQLAFIYMFALAAATLVATPSFFVVRGAMAVFSFPILVFLLVMIAVLADRITFDCTSMNEHLQSTGVGLLQSLGLVKSERKRSEQQPNSVKTTEEPSTEPTKKKSPTKRKHNPGVWVLYFAVFALPVFGLGQLVIQSPEDRRWAFTYLFFYLLSSLFLLVLISLLSLRKYLRERGVPMETSFAIRWLAVGMTSVFLVLFVLSLLPIPGRSLLTMDLPFHITSRDDLKASNWGWGREGAEGQGPQKGDGEAQDKPGGNQDGKGPDDGGKQTGDKLKGGKSNGANKNAAGKQNGGNKQKSDRNEEDEKQSQADDKGDSKNGEKKEEQAGDKNRKTSDENSPKKKGASNPSNEEKQNNSPRADDNKPQTERKSDGKRPDGKQPEQQQQQSARQSSSIEWNISATLQWLLMIVLAILAIIYGIIYRRELFVAVKGFLDWLGSIFGPKKREPVAQSHSTDEATLIEDLYPPFHTFVNPFANGTGWSREQVVRHMYRAILSWGYEHRIVRREDETPEEFMRRLFRRFPEQQESIAKLGTLYNRIAYARGQVSSSELKPMTDLWQWLVTKTPSVESR